MFIIRYVESVAADLSSIRAFERRHILDRIDQELAHEPTIETQQKKMLRGLAPPWEYVPPVWELRVDEYRVFYDVNEAAKEVVVRAVRRKPPHRTTEEIL